MGGRMHRAIVLLFGLLLALAAAVVMLPLGVAPFRSSPPEPVVAATSPAEARLGANTASAEDLVTQASLSAWRTLRWTDAWILGGLLATGGAASLLAWSRARRTHGRPKHATAIQSADARAAPASSHVARTAAAEQAVQAARADFATQLSLAVQADSSTSSNLKQHATSERPHEQHVAEQLANGADGPNVGPPDDWLRSEAGDKRAAAALCAVDDVLAAGGWRSRAAAAAARPDLRPEVQVRLALHPAERNIAAAVAERVRGTHPAWHVTAGAEHIEVEVGEPAAGPGLLLPVLQTADDGPWTHYLHAASAVGLAITGARAGDVLHGLLAELVCMYAPTNLALTVLGETHDELYRHAPQWVEPPNTSAATIERLAAAVGGAAGTGYRPLLLAAWEPDDALARALVALQLRLSTLRSPPIALLVAAERPSPECRVLSAALPALAVRLHRERLTAELRLLERRVAGRPPCFASGDVRELLRWLPRFGASLPPSIWDTIASSAP